MNAKTNAALDKVKASRTEYNELLNKIENIAQIKGLSGQERTQMILTLLQNQSMRHIETYVTDILDLAAVDQKEDTCK